MKITTDSGVIEIYPFVEQDEPIYTKSPRLVIYRNDGRVDYQNQTFSLEQAKQLIEAYEMATKLSRRFPTSVNSLQLE